MNLYHVGHKQAGQYMCIALSDKGKAIQYLVITVKGQHRTIHDIVIVLMISMITIFGFNDFNWCIHRNFRI